MCPQLAGGKRAGPESRTLPVFRQGGPGSTAAGRAGAEGSSHRTVAIGRRATPGFDHPAVSAKKCCSASDSSTRPGRRPAERPSAQGTYAPPPSLTPSRTAARYGAAPSTPGPTRHPRRYAAYALTARRRMHPASTLQRIASDSRRHESDQRRRIVVAIMSPKSRPSSSAARASHSIVRQKG